MERGGGRGGGRGGDGRETKRREKEIWAILFNVNINKLKLEEKRRKKSTD